jgi:hypothetical protein
MVEQNSETNSAAILSLIVINDFFLAMLEAERFFLGVVAARSSKQKRSLFCSSSNLTFSIFLGFEIFSGDSLDLKFEILLEKIS